MKLPDYSPPLPLDVLLADYSRWLDFVLASNSTIRGYDRQLADISKRYSDLRELSDYLRTCMRHRSQFFGGLAIQLTGKVAQLRARPAGTEPASTEVLRQLTHAHPIMQDLMAEIANALADISQSYQALFSTPSNAKNRLLAPVEAGRHRA